MKNIQLLLTIILLSLCSVQAQNTLTDNDINFKNASYNSSYVVADSNNLVLNVTTSLSSNLQETSRMHFLVYGNLEKLGLGIGAKINSRFKDFYKTTSAEILLAQKLVFKEKNLLNFGLNFGLHYNGVNDNYFNNFVDQSDPYIANNPQQNLRFIAGFGASYVWDNKLKVGFSMPELLKTENDFYPTLFSDVAYKQEFGKTKVLYIEPSLLLYSTNMAPATLEGAATFGYQNYAWLKLGGRSTKTFVLGVGGGYSIVNLGYNYNMNFGNYEVINQNQHNVNVCINFLQSKKKKKEEVIIVEEEVHDSIVYPYYVTKAKVEGEIAARYYVAVDSYKEEGEALIRANEVLMSGQKSFIMQEVNSGIYHVCIADDDDFESIVSKVLMYKNSIEPDAWIIENE